MGGQQLMDHPVMCPELARSKLVASRREADDSLRGANGFYHFVGQCASIDCLAVHHFASECFEQWNDVGFHPPVTLVVSVSDENPHFPALLPRSVSESLPARLD